MVAALAVLPDATPTQRPALTLLDDEDRALPLPDRREALAHSLFMGVDELADLFTADGRKRALICPLHRGSRWPTRCPVCALVECRLRVKINRRAG